MLGGGALPPQSELGWHVRLPPPRFPRLCGWRQKEHPVISPAGNRKVTHIRTGTCMRAFATNHSLYDTVSRDGKKPNPARTNRTRKYKFCQEPKPRTQMPWFLHGPFTEWNCRHIHTFYFASSSTSLVIINTIYDLWLVLQIIRNRWPHYRGAGILLRCPVGGLHPEFGNLIRNLIHLNVTEQF